MIYDRKPYFMMMYNLINGAFKASVEMFLLLRHWSPKSDSDFANLYLCHLCLVIFIHLYIYIYISCFGIIFGGGLLLLLFFFKFTIIVCDKLLYQTISTTYISTKFKMDYDGIISEFSVFRSWNRKLIRGHPIGVPKPFQYYL